MQIGNCGSPIELPEGWLVAHPWRRPDAPVPHRRGAARPATIRARCRARSAAPLLAAEDGERDGYVPNVVYSCGALVHAGNLILPFAVADTATTFAAVNLSTLLAAMD